MKVIVPFLILLTIFFITSALASDQSTDVLTDESQENSTYVLTIEEQERWGISNQGRKSA